MNTKKLEEQTIADELAPIWTSSSPDGTSASNKRTPDGSGMWSWRGAVALMLLSKADWLVCWRVSTSCSMRALLRLDSSRGSRPS